MRKCLIGYAKFSIVSGIILTLTAFLAIYILPVFAVVNPGDLGYGCEGNPCPAWVNVTKGDMFFYDENTIYIAANFSCNETTVCNETMTVTGNFSAVGGSPTRAGVFKTNGSVGEWALFEINDTVNFTAAGGITDIQPKNITLNATATDGNYSVVIAPVVLVNMSTFGCPPEAPPGGWPKNVPGIYLNGTPAGLVNTTDCTQNTTLCALMDKAPATWNGTDWLICAPQFGGATTNLSYIAQQGNFSAIENFTIEVPGKGKIVFQQNVSFDSPEKAQAVMEFAMKSVMIAGKIGINESEFNGTGNRPNLNLSAKLTMYNVTGLLGITGDPQIIMSDYGGGNEQTCPICSDIVWDGENLTFTVASFSDYGLTDGINVTLQSPGNFTYVNNLNVNFTYIPEWNATITMDNCTLWGNFTGTWAANESNATDLVNGSINWINNTVPSEGSYLWNVYCYDTTGLKDYEAVNWTVTVDTTSPTAEFGTDPVDNYNTSSQTVIFDLKCSDNYVVDTLQLWGNWSGWHANQTNSTPINDTYWNVSVAGIPEGDWKWGVWCNDSASNEDWSSNRTFTVDLSPPTFANEAINISSVNGSSEVVKFNFSVSDGGVGVDKCWAELTLESSSSNTTPASPVGGICTVETNISEVGDFSFKPWANDTLNNIGNGTVKSGVRLDSQIQASVQDTVPNLTAAGNYDVNFTRLVRLNNSLGSLDWSKSLTNSLPSNVSLWFVYEGNACSGTLINSGSGTTATWTADSPASTDSNETICYTYSSGVTLAAISWVQDGSANVSRQDVRTDFNISENISDPFMIDWDLTGTIDGETECDVNCTGNNVNADDGWNSYAEAYSDWVTESQTSWAQNLSATSSVTTQYINTTINLPNNGSVSFTSVSYSEPNACPTGFSCDSYLSSYDVPTTGNITYYSGSGDVLTETFNNWTQNMTATSSAATQYINASLTITDNSTINFTSVSWTTLTECSEISASFSGDTIGTSFNVSTNNVSNSYDCSGDAITESETNWRQDDTPSNVSVQYLNNTVTVDNNASINFTSISYSPTACPTGYTNCENITSWNVPTTDNTTTLNADGDWLTETYLAWQQYVGMVQTVTYQRIESRLNVSNNLSTDFTGISWSNTTLPNANWGVCDTCSGNISVNANSYNESVYRYDTGDVITESQTQWAQNLSATSTILEQYINTTISLLNNGSVDFTASPYVNYTHPNLCPSPYTCTGFNTSALYSVPTTGNVTYYSGSGNNISATLSALIEEVGYKAKNLTVTNGSTLSFTNIIGNNSFSTNSFSGDGFLKIWNGSWQTITPTNICSSDSLTDDTNWSSFTVGSDTWKTCEVSTSNSSDYKVKFKIPHFSSVILQQGIGDITPPSVVINAPVPFLNTTSSVNILNVTVTDTNLNASTVFYIFENSTGQYNASGTANVWTNIPQFGSTDYFNTSFSAEAGLADGKYAIRIKANDTAGNQNATEFVNLSIDNMKPVVSLSLSATSIYLYSSVTVTCSASDVGSGVKNVTVTSSDGTAICSADASSCSATYTPSATGTKTITCTAYDYVSISNSASKDLTVSYRPSGVAPPPAPPTASKLWDKITPGVVKIMKITENVGFTEISIEVKNQVNNVEITVKKLVAKPAEITVNVTGKAYRYIQITHRNIEEANIEKATINFTVNKTWISDNNIDKSKVVLNRYTTEWEKLSTTLVNETDDWVYYSAITPGFSVFAISGEVAVPQICTPNAKQCVGNDLQQCNVEGTVWETIETCEYGCDPVTLTCKLAPEAICTPNAKQCVGSDLQQCSTDGLTWTTLETCEYGCDPTTLTCKEKPVVPPVVDYMWLWVIIILIVIILAVLIIYFERERIFKRKTTPNLEFKFKS